MLNGYRIGLVAAVLLFLAVGTLADTVHTPAKGSAERTAILDGVRAEYKKMTGPDGRHYRGTITFDVTFLKVHNGWAWVYAEPRSSDSRDSFGENDGYLLHLEDGKWQVKGLPAPIDDPDDPENLDYPGEKDIAAIRKRFPGVPRDIFPTHEK